MKKLIKEIVNKKAKVYKKYKNFIKKFDKESGTAQFLEGYLSALDWVKHEIKKVD